MPTGCQGVRLGLLLSPPSDCTLGGPACRGFSTGFGRPMFTPGVQVSGDSGNFGPRGTSEGIEGCERR